MSKREKISGSREKKVKRIKSQHSKPNIDLESLPPVNIDCFALEEEESIEDCFLKYKETCSEIRKHLSAIRLAKIGKEKAVMQEHKKAVFMCFLRLKKLNRVDKHRCKKIRDAVTEERQKVDVLNLQCQNLLYELTYLEKEVTKCLKFRSKDEDIELVPVEEFYLEAPENISKPGITKSRHEFRLARLAWELEQRIRFAEKLKEAKVEREQHIQAIKKLEESLSNILPALNSVVEATGELQSKFGIPLHALHVEHKGARFLPKPLYILYVQVCAYREALDKKIQASVEGSIEEATNLQTETEELTEESGESDQEDANESNNHRRRVSSRRKDTIKDIFKKHPLSVCVTIEAKESKVVVEFKYLFHLHIVTVTIKSAKPLSCSLDKVGNLLKLDTFLNCLFPNDTGRKSPNPANEYLFKKYGPEKCSFSNNTTGWPYIWAQKIAGFEFLDPPDKEVNPKSGFEVSSSYMKIVVGAIRARLVARIQLSQQIVSLGQKTAIPAKFVALYPLKISSHLKKWNPAEWKEVESYPKFNELKEQKIISQDSLIFSAVLERGSAVLSVLVIIPPDYPVNTPIFLLKLFWKGTSTAYSSFALRELEEEVNCHFIQNLSKEYYSHILSCQLYHLTICFDVFLETECSSDSFAGPHEFVHDKVVMRPARGRFHSRPYKCFSSQGIFTFR